uniref:Cell shape-determining protein MreC n=1 Tax=Roseihalotalea indica TaxID=2867963 RepID=A0AA49PZW9_9BACT|nr:rod shape-determining protein MreC [Tunicatimonas sp. TK19036]
MYNLLSFLLKYRSTILFLVLEGLSGFFIVNNNPYHQAAVINSSNRMVASIIDASNSASEYLNLQSANDQLAEENARLRAVLLTQSREPANNPFNPSLEDSLALQALSQDSLVLLPSALTHSDSVRFQQYSFIPAKVVDNTVQHFKNHVTINKGRADGIEPNMGVISPNGVVGKVKDVSEHYALITSILHTDMNVSALVKRSNTLGSIEWKGNNPTQASLKYIPIHINIITGDTIVTSGYSGVYPPEILIGTVKEVRPEEDAAFYDVDVDLSNDFFQLSYVYVVKNKLKQEKDSLLQQTIVGNE